MASQPLCQIITPVGMLGYGFEEKLIEHELAQLVSTGIPTAIILDSGSTDSGPQKLALGSMSCPRSAYAKDLAKLLRLAHTFRVPLIFASAGGDGTDEHVEEIRDVIKEIAAEEENRDYSFNTIALFSGIDKSIVLQRLNEEALHGCGPFVPRACETDIKESLRIVAQMGHEPFIDAMEANPYFNIIIGGRAYDPSPYAAYCVHQLKQQTKNLDPHEIQSRLGGFIHMGKIMECGGLCALPKSHGAVATVYMDGVFDVRPTASNSMCTPLSVAAHALYENTRPDVLRGPGGLLNLQDSVYEQLSDGRSVRVSGSRFCPSVESGKPYQLKLEAARVAGYRSMFMGSVKDHILISQIDRLLSRVKLYVDQQHAGQSGNWKLDFHVYGKDQYTAAGLGQLFIVAEALATTQELANSIASKTRVGMIHAPYPGQKATSGNVGFGIGGLMEIELGRCAEFSLYHLMDLKPGEERLSLTEDASLEALKGSLLRGTISRIGQGNPASFDKPLNGNTTRLHVDAVRAPPENMHPDGAAMKDQPTQERRVLSDLCRIIRSKNAGPYEITIDAIFYSQSIYQAIKDSGLLSADNVARTLRVEKDEIVWMGFFDPALAFKVTIPRIRAGRKKSAGGFMEDDIHGSQEHIGLANLEITSLSC